MSMVGLSPRRRAAAETTTETRRVWIQRNHESPTEKYLLHSEKHLSNNTASFIRPESWDNTSKNTGMGNQAKSKKHQRQTSQTKRFTQDFKRQDCSSMANANCRCFVVKNYKASHFEFTWRLIKESWHRCELVFNRSLDGFNPHFVWCF